MLVGCFFCQYFVIIQLFIEIYYRKEAELMVSRNNTQLLEQRSALREVPHWGLRRTTMGVASVLLGTSVWLAGTNVVHADVIPNSGEGVDTGANSGTGVQTTNATVGFKPETQAIDTTNMTSVNTQHLQVRQTMNGMQKQYTQSQLPTTGEQGQQVMNVGQTQAVNAVNETSLNTQAGQQMNVQTNADRQNALLYGSEKVSRSQTALVNPVGLTESKAISVAGTDNQQYGTDMTSRFYFGQSSSHNTGQTDSSSDYMGHPDSYFRDAQVLTNIDNLEVDTGGPEAWQWGNNVWKVQLPKSITSLSDWFTKVNQSPDYLLGFIDESGARHYLEPSSFSQIVGSDTNAYFAFDAVNMDDSGKWVKVGTWRLNFSYQSDGYPYLQASIHMAETPKSISAVPPLPLFITSPNQKRIFNARVSRFAGAITGTDVSDNGSSIYAPIGPGITESGRDMTAHNYGAVYTFSPAQLNFKLNLTIDGGGDYNFASYHNVSFSNGKDTIVLNNANAWVSEMNAYDSNGNVIGKYKWQFNDLGGASVGEEYIVNHASWLKYVPNDSNSGAIPIPLVATYLSNNGGEKGKTAFTFMPNVYSARPTSLDIKKVIIHYVDAKTGQSLNQDETYEISANRSDTNNVWTAQTPTVRKVSGPNTSTFSNLSVDASGMFKFTVQADDKATFNVQFAIPNINKLNVTYPINIYKDWNPYVLTVDVVKPVATPKVTVKYVDDAGQTLKTDQVHFSNQSGSVANWMTIQDGSNIASAAVTRIQQALHFDANSLRNATGSVVWNDAMAVPLDMYGRDTDNYFYNGRDYFQTLIQVARSNVGHNASEVRLLKHGDGEVARAKYKLNDTNSYYIDPHGHHIAIGEVDRVFYDPHGQSWFNHDYSGPLMITVRPGGVDQDGNSAFEQIGGKFGDLTSIAMRIELFDTNGQRIQLPDNLDVSCVKSLDDTEAVQGLDGAVSTPYSGGAYYSSNKQWVTGTRSSSEAIIVGGQNHGIRFGNIGDSSEVPGAYNQPQWDLSLPDSMAYNWLRQRTYTRTINFVNPQGHALRNPMVQTVNWDDFSEDGHTWTNDPVTSKSVATVTVPQINGYSTQATVIPEKIVDHTVTHNDVVNVVYVPAGQLANLSYQAPTGYLIKDGQQLPHQVRSDSEGNLTWDNSTTVPSSVSGSAAVTTTVKVTKVPVVTADSQEGLRQAITFDQDRIAIVDAQHMFTDSNDGFKDKQRLSVEWNPSVVSNITGSMGTLDATGKMSTYKGTVATVSFLDLGNTFYTDKNGKQTQIAKIVRTYYDPIGDGTLKIAINPQRTGAGVNHSPFWLGATIDGDLSIAVKTAYYDQHGNLIHIGDNEDVLPITGLDHHVVGQNVIEPLGGASVMSNDSLKKVHDPQTGLMAYYPDRVTDCLLVFGGSNHGYRFGSLLNVDGTPSGAPKGISGAQEMYNLPKKLINQTMTVRHRQVTYHFVDASDGHVIHDPVVENVSWHRFNGDQDVSDFDEDKSLTMPTILIDGYALDQAVRKQLPNSISSDSNNDLDIVLPFKSTSSSATITVYVTPAIEKLDPNDPNSWPTDKDGHQLHAYDFARDLEYQVTYAPQYHQSDFDRKVHASRDISFDAANRVFKFGNWKLDGNASGATGSVTVPKGYNSTVDSTITFVNGHSLQADLNWTPSLNFDMSTWLPSGLSDVAGYSDKGLVNRVKEFISYGVTKQANRVITDPSQLPPDSNVKASDLQRTVTRVVNITDPNTQAVKSQTQTVTFKRGCELDPVTDQLVKYTNWNESSHHFDAVAVPVVDGWMPSSQVPAVDVTPDTESSTINIMYRANQQVVTVSYTDQGKPVGSFTINGVTGGSVNNLGDQISQHVPQHYTVDKGSLPTTYKFTSDAHQVINVPVSHGVTNIDPDDSGTWPSEINRNDLFKSVSRTIKYVVPSKYVGQSAYQGLIQTVNFKRGATFDEVTRKATFGAWEVNGNPASFVQVMVPGLTGYTPDRNVVNAVTPTGDTQDSTVTVTYAPNDETQVINYVDSQTGKVIHSQTVNGKMDATVTVTSEVPVHWRLADGQSVPTSMTLMDHPQALTIKITHVIKPVDPDSPISWKVPGLAKHDLFKTVHRIIKYDVPSKYANQSQFNAVSQAVNFKRGATYDEVTKQVTYLPWQVDGQVSQFASVKSPVLAGYAVDQAQVAVVAPKGDDQDTTVTVQYTPQDQTWILQYVDADDQTKVVGTQELVAKTDETKSITPEVPTGWQLSSFAYVPKSIMFAPGMPTLKLTVTHSLTKLDPNNPSSWPSGITERDFKRNIKRIVKIVDPNGQPDSASTTQSVEFTRDVFWDEVAQKPTFGEWSYGGLYTFDAITVPEQSGYAPSGNVPSLIVTPDDTDLTLTITYLAQGQSVNIMYLDHDQNIVGSQVISGKTGEVKSITYQLPQGWQVVSGQTNPQSVTFKAQNNSPINVEVEHVITPVDLNDSTKWPTDVHGHTLTKHDFDRVITRAITINEPAKNNQQTQSAEFTRSVGFDQVSHEFVFGDWSHNGKQTLPAVSVSSIAGYAINGSVPALVVTPDSQNTQVTVNYVANGQTNVYRFVDDQNNGQVVGEDRQFAGKTGQTVKLTIDLPSGYVLSKGQTLPQSYLFKASDNQPIVIHLSHQIKDASHDKDAQTTKVISRMINVKLPDGHVTTQVQSVTFSRSASRDAITGHLSYGAWNHDGQQSLPAYVQDSIQGYDNVGSAPRITVTPNDHDLTVELGYHRQANRQIDPNDPSTWPDGLNRSDLIRDFKRVITIQAPQDGKLLSGDNPGTVTQTFTFMRSAEQDPTNNRIIFHAWNEPQHQFASVVAPQYHGYDPSVIEVASVMVTPDTDPQSLHDVTISYTKQADHQIDPDDPATWPAGLKKSDVIRDVDRVVTITTPDGHDQVTKQHFTFKRHAIQDPVTDKITYQPWNEPQHQFDAVKVPTVKGYDPSVSEVPAITVTPDTVIGSKNVHVSYTKQADRQIDPHDPSTWPDGVTKDDLIREIHRTITIKTPDGHSQTITQTVTFTRGATQDPVTDKITFKPWSENGHHHFDAVPVPTLKGYTPNITEIPGIDVTPDTVLDDGDTNIEVSYTKNAPIKIDPNDPSTWPKGMTEHDLKRHIERNITITMPDGTKQTVHQSVDFVRNATQDPVTDQITFGPWSHDGKYHFDDVSVPQVKGYDSNIKQVPGIDVTPDTVLNDGDTDIQVTFTKQPDRQIDPNDPSTWPKGLTEHDFKRDIKRTVTLVKPDGTKQTITQEVVFTRGATQDPVTDKVTFGPWSENGHHHFGDIQVPQIPGYHSNVQVIPGIDVTPDTVLSDADQTIKITYRVNIKAVHDQKLVTRTINVMNPESGQVDSRVQRVTLYRDGEYDASTGNTKWESWTQSQFKSVLAPSFAGYQADLLVVPVMNVNGQTKNSVVTINYRLVKFDLGVHYVTTDGQLVGQQVIKDYTIGQDVSRLLQIPDHYAIVGDGQMTGKRTMTYQVQVIHDHPTIPDDLSSPDDIQIADWYANANDHSQSVDLNDDSNLDHQSSSVVDNHSSANSAVSMSDAVVTAKTSTSALPKVLPSAVNSEMPVGLVIGGQSVTHQQSPMDSESATSQSVSGSGLTVKVGNSVDDVTDNHHVASELPQTGNDQATVLALAGAGLMLGVASLGVTKQRKKRV